MTRCLVRRDTYRDSVELMRVATLVEKLPGVSRAALMMATPANRELLAGAGLLDATGAAAGPNDLVVAVAAADPTAAERALGEAARLLDEHAAVAAPSGERPSPRSIAEAAGELPHANLAIISTPGTYATAEALKALKRGLHAVVSAPGGSWGARCLSLAPYVAGTGPTDGATAPPEGANVAYALPRFIGVENYHKIALADARFREPVGRTIYFTVVAVGAETLLGLAMALRFNRQFWGRGLLRTLAILPRVATPTAIALVFVMMYHPSLGVANYLLSVIGLSPWRWTYSSQTALYVLALVDVWQWTPLIMLIALVAQRHIVSGLTFGAVKQ